MGLEDLPVPDYTTLSKRQGDLDIDLPTSSKTSPMHLVIDSTVPKVRSPSITSGSEPKEWGIGERSSPSCGSSARFSTGSTSPDAPTIPSACLPARASTRRPGRRGPDWASFTWSENPERRNASLRQANDRVLLTSRSDFQRKRIAKASGPASRPATRSTLKPGPDQSPIPNFVPSAALAGGVGQGRYGEIAASTAEHGKIARLLHEIGESGRGMQENEHFVKWDFRSVGIRSVSRLHLTLAQW